MPPTIPREIQNLGKSVERAYIARDAVIEEGLGLGEFDQPLIDEMLEFAALLENMKRCSYYAWQRLGGRSNVESITAERRRQIEQEKAWELEHPVECGCKPNDPNCPHAEVGKQDEVLVF